MAGGTKTQSTAPTRYAGIQVQTSSAGVAIARGWGTFRVSAQLLWYGAFKSTAVKQQTQSGGKGGGGGSGNSTTSYTYTASLVLGMCAGPVASVRTVYRDSSVFTGANALGAAGLSLFQGAIGQTPWPYLTASFPAQAFSYSGVAYAAAAGYALSTSATVPNHSFEVQSPIRAPGSDDANAADVLQDILGIIPSWDSTWTADTTELAAYSAAAGLLVSPLADAQTTAADLITEILSCTNTDAVWSDGVLKIRSYGDTQVGTWTPSLDPIIDLGPADFLQDDGDTDVVVVDVPSTSAAYNVVSVEFLDRTHSYDTQVAPGLDQGAIETNGEIKEDPVSLHSICDPLVAARVAQLRVQRSAYTRRTFTFSLAALGPAALLEPMDLVTVTSGELVRVLVRVTDVSQSDPEQLDFVAEEMLVGAAHAAELTRQAPVGALQNFETAPGPATPPVLINPPLRLTQGLYEVWIATAGGPMWGGAEVWVSTDGSSYERQGTVTAKARYGATTTAFAAVVDPDTTSSLGVDLSASGGTLTPGTQADADVGNTLALVGSEVIAFSDAALTAASQYTLGTYLRRGQEGTTPASEPAGTPFVRLDSAIGAVAYDQSRIGHPIYIKFRSFNVFGRAFEDLSSCAAYEFTPTAPTQQFGEFDWTQITGIPQVVKDYVESGGTSVSTESVPGAAWVGDAPNQRRISDLLDQVDQATQGAQAAVAKALSLFGTDDQDLLAVDIIQLANRVRDIDQRIAGMFQGRPPGPYVAELATTTATSAETLNVLGVVTPDGLGFTFNDTSVSFADGTTLAVYRAGVTSVTGGLQAQLTQNYTATTSALMSQASLVTQVQAMAQSNAAAIYSEQQARANADSAEASARLLLAAQVGTNSSTIQQNYIALTQADSTEATARLALTSDYNGFKSYASQQFVTFSSNDSTLAAQYNSLNADYGPFKSSVNNQLIALSNAGSSYAASISSLMASYNGLSGTVSTQATALTNLNNQFIGSWKVSIASSFAGYNNVIAGIELVGSSGSGGVYGAINLLADRVTFIGSDGSTARFVLVGGSYLQIDRLYVGYANIGTAQVGNANIAGGAVSENYYAQQLFNPSGGGNALPSYAASPPPQPTGSTGSGATSGGGTTGTGGTVTGGGTRAQTP